MNKIAVYKKDTGKIEYFTLGTQENDQNMPDDTYDWVLMTEDSNGGIFVDINDDNIIKKQEDNITIDKLTIQSNGVDEAVISNIPNPSLVIVVFPDEDYSMTIIDGSLELSSESPGNCIVEIIPENPRYIEKIFYIKVE